MVVLASWSMSIRLCRRQLKSLLIVSDCSSCGQGDPWTSLGAIRMTLVPTRDDSGAEVKAGGDLTGAGALVCPRHAGPQTR
jgi:hypothetical protein